ncbi:MAG TPA: preprotein translocase subunit SecE [Terracidiphilus sp.]|jgi:preprotein translocase subunit SecE
MASSKTEVEKGEQRSSKLQAPGALTNISEGALGTWGRFTSFLSDVRSEMRKVVAPSRSEVQATTTVVIITVFVFGLFFWITDLVFNRTLQVVLHRLGGVQ